VFGSVARGGATADSEVNILVTINKQIVRSLFQYAGVAADLEDAVGQPVGVVDRARLRPEIRRAVLAEAIVVYYTKLH